MDRPNHNNPAGRLLFVFERATELAKTRSHEVGSIQMAGIFNTAPSFAGLVNCTFELARQVDALELAISESEIGDYRKGIFQRQIDPIRQSARSFTFSFSPGPEEFHWRWSIEPTATLALELMAAELAEEPTAPDSTLDRLRELAEELRVEIEAASSIPKGFRAVLLELVRLIRDSVDQYSVRGNDGVREALSRVLGELFLSGEDREQAEVSEPTLWSKFKSYVGVANSVATSTRNAEYLVGEANSAADSVAQLLGGQ